MKAIRTVLAPVDFSATSSVALEYATDMARRCEASLHLLHVVTDADVSPGTEAFWGFSEDDVQQKWVTEATAQLAALCPPDEHPHCRSSGPSRSARRLLASFDTPARTISTLS